MEPVIARGLAYAPYADLLWVETGTPDLEQAREFAEAIHAEYPDQMLAYNCSPSFNWKAALDDDQIAKFQRELAAMGYRFQFITLAGFHALNHAMFDLARGYAEHGMTAYVDLQETRVRRRGSRASPPSSTSARSAPATSTWSPPPSTRPPRPPRCAAPPRRSSSTRNCPASPGDPGCRLCPAWPSPAAGPGRRSAAPMAGLAQHPR